MERRASNRGRPELVDEGYVKLEPIDEPDTRDSYRPSRLPGNPVIPTSQPQRQYEPKPSIHQCTLCVHPPVSFTTIPSMLAHYIDFHKVQPENASTSKISESHHLNSISEALRREGKRQLVGVIYGRVDEPIRVFGCCLCASRFTNFGTFTRHLKVHGEPRIPMLRTDLAELDSPNRVETEEQCNIEIVSVQGGCSVDEFESVAKDASLDAEIASNSSGSPHLDKSWKPEITIPATTSLRKQPKRTLAKISTPDSQSTIVDERGPKIPTRSLLDPPTRPENPVVALAQPAQPSVTTTMPVQILQTVKVEDESVVPDSTEELVNETPDGRLATVSSESLQSTIWPGKSITFQVVRSDDVERCVRVNGEPTWMCKRCRIIYQRKSDLLHHLTTKHTAIKVPDSVIELVCQHCQEKFADIQSLRCHHCSAGHTTNDAAVVGFREISENLGRLLLEKQECADCGTVMDGLRALLNHLLAPKKSHIHCTKHRVHLDPIDMMRRYHTKTGPTVLCPICGLRMRTNEVLYQHFRLNHELFQIRDSGFKCKICTKDFPDLTRTIRHFQNWHSAPVEDIMKMFGQVGVDEVAYCHICENSFPDTTDLIVHMGSHQGDNQPQVSAQAVKLQTEARPQVKTYSRDVICRTQAIEILNKQKLEIEQDLINKIQKHKKAVEFLSSSQSKRSRRSGTTGSGKKHADVNEETSESEDETESGESKMPRGKKKENEKSPRETREARKKTVEDTVEYLSSNQSKRLRRSGRTGSSKNYADEKEETSESEDETESDESKMSRGKKKKNKNENEKSPRETRESRRKTLEDKKPTKKRKIETDKETKADVWNLESEKVKAKKGEVGIKVKTETEKATVQTKTIETLRTETEKARPPVISAIYRAGSQEPGNLRCAICDVKFTQVQQLVDHYSKNHANLIVLKQSTALHHHSAPNQQVLAPTASRNVATRTYSRIRGDKDEDDTDVFAPLCKYEK